MSSDILIQVAIFVAFGITALVGIFLYVWNRDTYTTKHVPPKDWYIYAMVVPDLFLENDNDWVNPTDGQELCIKEFIITLGRMCDWNIQHKFCHEMVYRYDSIASVAYRTNAFFMCVEKFLVDHKTVTVPPRMNADGTVKVKGYTYQVTKKKKRIYDDIVQHILKRPDVWPVREPDENSKWLDWFIQQFYPSMKVSTFRARVRVVEYPRHLRDVTEKLIDRGPTALSILFGLWHNLVLTSDLNRAQVMSIRNNIENWFRIKESALDRLFPIP